MRTFLLALAAASFATPAVASDVGVSVRIGEPGFYGRIDIGNAPPPRLVYAEPILVRPAPVTVMREPLYLRVPPGHAKHWAKHCQRYNACSQPVYFVQDAWYSNVYVPHYRRTYAVAAPVAVVSPPVVEYRARPPRAQLFSVPITSVRAVVGPPEQRCWVERQQVVEERSDGMNVPGAIVGGVIGGVLGHQVGGGRGRDIATIGGAVAGAAIGGNVGRGGTQVSTQDVQRCATAERSGRPEYWDVTYHFHGVEHNVQLKSPPGRLITVDAEGNPRV